MPLCNGGNLREYVRAQDPGYCDRVKLVSLHLNQWFNNLTNSQALEVARGVEHREYKLPHYLSNVSQNLFVLIQCIVSKNPVR